MPAAAAAVRHAAGVSIRTEPAGHALLPHVPDKYAPAHDSPARAALGRAAAAAHASDPSGTVGVPSSTHPVLRRCLPPASAVEYPRVPASAHEYPVQYGTVAGPRTPRRVPRDRLAKADSLRGTEEVPASTARSVPWRRAGAIRGFSGIERAWRAPPGNVGDNVGAYVGAEEVGAEEVGANVGGLVPPGLVGTGVGAGVGAAHAHNRTARVRKSDAKQQPGSAWSTDECSTLLHSVLGGVRRPQ
jgi:hypothetical protein